MFGIKLEIILVKENGSNKFSSEVYDPLATVSWLGLEYHIYISSYWLRFESNETLVGHPHDQNIIVSLGVSCHLYLKTVTERQCSEICDITGPHMQLGVMMLNLCIPASLMD